MLPAEGHYSLIIIWNKVISPIWYFAKHLDSIELYYIKMKNENVVFFKDQER